MTRVALEPCFVLHERRWRETSLIVEVFGVQSGRVGLVARGARRPKSPFRGLLQPFIPLLVSWSGRGELATLVAVEADCAAAWLTGSALMGGLYMNELLVRLMHRHDPHPDLFEIYRRALERLRSQGPVEPVLRVFEKGLLRSIGYALILAHDAESGAPIVAQREYRYVAEVGAVPAGRRSDGGVRIHGRTLQALAGERFECERDTREAKQLMRYLIGGLLGERPLGVRALFRRFD